MKKKLLLLLLLFIPFIVNASKIDDLNLKWSDSLNSDGYIYNPYFEADEKFLNSDVANAKWYNKSKILELDDGYIIFGNNSVSKYDFHDGLKEYYYYDDMTYLIENDLIYVLSYKSSTKTSTLEILNMDLQLIKTFSEQGYRYLTMFIEGNNLVCTARNNSNQNYRLYTVVLNKTTYEVEKESQIFTYNSPSIESNKVFTASNTTFYIDENYDLKASTMLENDKYTLIYNAKINLYTLDGKLEKSNDLSPSNYNAYGYKTIIKDNQIYVGLGEYLYDSTNKEYNIRATYHLYDDNLNLLDSTELELESIEKATFTTINMYGNENGVFTSYKEQKYEIDENFDLVETESSNLYNDNKINVDNEIVEPNIKYLAYRESGYLVLYAEQELAEELENKYEKYNIYPPTYDSYYDEENKEFIVVINLKYRIYENSSYTYKSKTELIIFDSQNEEIKKRVDILNEQIIDVYESNVVMNITDDYITFGITTNGVTKILFYDHDYNLVKDFKTKQTGNYLIQKAYYKNGRLLLIYTEPYVEPDPETLGVNENNSFITSSSVKDFPLAKIFVYREHNGLYTSGVGMIVEYYEAPFNIITKTDGNGSVTSTKQQADSGETVVFNVKPNEGYVLGEVKVTDNEGNVVTFTDYTFTMPSADVTIEATFIKEEHNPETADILIILFIITAIISTILIIKNKKKLEWME